MPVADTGDETVIAHTPDCEEKLRSADDGGLSCACGARARAVCNTLRTQASDQLAAVTKERDEALALARRNFEYGARVDLLGVQLEKERDAVKEQLATVTAERDAAREALATITRIAEVANWTFFSDERGMVHAIVAATDPAPDAQQPLPRPPDALAERLAAAEEYIEADEELNAEIEAWTPQSSSAATVRAVNRKQKALSALRALDEVDNKGDQ